MEERINKTRRKARQKARSETYAQNLTGAAKRFVPKMYAELRKQRYGSYLCFQIEKDCASMWEVKTTEGGLQ
jgi:hypothetical protein